MSIAKISGIIGVGLGLLIGLFFTLLSVIGAGVDNDPQSPAWVLVIFGIGATIFLPIFYGGISFLQGLIGAWLYNLAAEWIGPLEVQLK